MVTPSLIVPSHVQGCVRALHRDVIAGFDQPANFDWFDMFLAVHSEALLDRA
jgi:hypothetical protein